MPFPPGGSTDLVACIVSVPLGEELGRPIVIDNRSGAAGTVGAEIAAHATKWAQVVKDVGIEPQ